MAGSKLGSAPVWFQVARPHILLIVFASTLTYGWIFTEHFSLLVPMLAVWDWFIVNFTNKAVDLDEDQRNAIPGATEVGRNKKLVEGIGAAMSVAGLVGGHFLLPQLTPVRVAFTFIGIIYNYRLIPWWSKEGLTRTRLKEMYFFKNFGSAVLFIFSVFIYPLIGLGAVETYPLRSLLLAIAFFVPLEITYEIVYDLRDVDGDRAVGVPTYPVVHGTEVARKIILGLLILATIPMLVGAGMGWLRLREWVVVAAVIQQYLLFQRYCASPKLPNQPQTVVFTMMGAAQLFSYCLWVVAGLPLGA